MNNNQKEIAMLLHKNLGGSVLSEIMRSDLKDDIKQVAIVGYDVPNFHLFRTIETFYVNNHDEIFTLAGKLDIESNQDIKLIDLIQNPIFYLAAINTNIGTSPSNLRVIVKNVDDYLLENKTDFVSVYNQLSTSNLLKSSLPQIQQVKNQLDIAINNLTNNTTSLKNIEKNDYQSFKSTLLTLLSHYMFETNGERFFFTNPYSNWYDKLPDSNTLFHQSEIATQNAKLATALQHWNETNKHSLADPIVATFVITYWDALFQYTVFMREDGAAKKITAESDAITILSSTTSAKFISEYNSADSRLIVLQ